METNRLKEDMKQRAKTFGQIEKDLEQLRRNQHQDPKAGSERYNLFRVKWLSLGDVRELFLAKIQRLHDLWFQQADWTQDNKEEFARILGELLECLK